MINKLEVGNRIAGIRKNFGYSQSMFAVKLGVSTQAVSKWETGLSLPDIEILLNLSWMSKISINNLLDGNEYIDHASGINRGLFHIGKLLVCPVCRDKLLLNDNDNNKPFYACKIGHHYDVIDGVVYFNTREIPGELWSLWLRNYDHYLEEQRNPGLPRYAEGELYYKEAMWREIEQLRPHTIMDIACGTGSGIKYMIERIHWPVTIITADLSHRILKYNQVFFSSEWKNPYVDMVYLACDCANIPLTDNSIDMVFSNGGFESMQQRMKEGFREAFRILKPGGHAVYNMSVVDDHESENTKKWIHLYLGSGGDNHADTNTIHDIQQWIAKCKETGFQQNRSVKIYSEMPAPDDDVFPFENMVLRWMAQYVIISKKMS